MTEATKHSAKEVHQVTEKEAASRLDFEALRHVVEHSDADLFASLYANDAEVRVLNRDTPPGSPFELHSEEEIAEYLRDVFDQQVTHRIEQESSPENSGHNFPSSILMNFLAVRRIFFYRALANVSGVPLPLTLSGKEKR